MPRKSPYSIELSAVERAELEARARTYTLPYRDVVRAKIVYAAQGLSNDEIAARLDTRASSRVGSVVASPPRRPVTVRGEVESCGL